jgi:Raf kinase inhibitor-like YbhB/YbcL family protein
MTGTNMKTKIGWMAAACGLLLTPVAAARDAGTIAVTSSAFANNGTIPADYTCEGRGIAPPFSWATVPPQTKSIAVIVDDPDAPGGAFDHLVLFNLAPSQRSLPSDASKSLTTTSDLMAAKNSGGGLGFAPICPPNGRHHYRFQVMALDTMLSLRPGVSAREVQTASNGHIIARGELIGMYQKK